MDPLTVGTSIAAVTGAAAAANLIARNEFIKAIGLPAAKVAGEHLAQSLKKALEPAVEAKQANNLQAHLESLRGKLGDDFRPDPTMSLEWIAGAENVDPDDKELSEAWRGVLLAIGNRDRSRQALLSVVKSLTPEEAYAFLNLRKRRIFGLAHVEHRSRLQDLGLIHRPSEIALRPDIVLMTLTLALFVGAIFLMPPAMFAFREWSSVEIDTLQNSRSLTFVRAVAPVVMFAYCLTLAVTAFSPRPTATGAALMEFAAQASGSHGASERSIKASQEAKAESKKRKRSPRPA